MNWLNLLGQTAATSEVGPLLRIYSAISTEEFVHSNTARA
jgi:hypothetical protein